MIRSTIARQYTTALYELASEENQQEDVRDQLLAVKGLIDGSEDLKQVFENPAISPLKKLAIFEALEPNLSLGVLSSNFFKLLIKKGRLNYLAPIIEEYESLERERRGEVEVELTTARDLDNRILEDLKTKLQKTTGKSIVLKSAVDSELIGGIVAKIGGTVYDGSVEHQLQRIQKRLGED